MRKGRPSKNGSRSKSRKKNPNDDLAALVTEQENKLNRLRLEKKKRKNENNWRNTDSSYHRNMDNMPDYIEEGVGDDSDSNFDSDMDGDNLETNLSKKKLLGQEEITTFINKLFSKNVNYFRLRKLVLRMLLICLY